VKISGIESCNEFRAQRTQLQQYEIPLSLQSSV